MRRYAIRRAVGLAESGGYRVQKVGSEGGVAVARSAAFYDIRSREPQRPFEREVPTVPAKIFYFTEIAGVRGNNEVMHAWRRDGKLTDWISLDVRSTQWRTWTYKRNLTPGASWILTTELLNGAVLDVREFHIA